MANLNSFISTINQLLRQQDGLQLSKIIKLPFFQREISKSHLQLAQRIKTIDIISYCQTNISDSGIATIVGNTLRSLSLICDGSWTEAYAAELEAYNAILVYYRDEQTNWLSPVFLTISNDLRLVAIQADLRTEQRDNENLRDALRNLTNGFNIVAKERTPYTDPQSKKLSLFGVTNVLFKIYFKLNTLQLCSKLINVVERPGPSNASNYHTLFPVSDVVTYKFYIGRLKMFEDKYEDARDCFLFALRHTPETEFKNRQRILSSLIPVQMSLGVMPSNQIAKKYGFHDFLQLGQAVISGNLRLYEEILQKNQQEFISRGTYLVLERIKVIAYRNLMKRVFNIVSNTRIKLTTFESIFIWLGEEEVDLDEIECIVANLIYQNKVKGYISHQKRTLILSKVDPFPKNSVIKQQTISNSI